MDDECICIKKCFSIVCPIKDEVDLIPKTLPSFYDINPTEVILCVDKPAPQDVVKTITKVARACRAEDKTRIIEVERNPEYAFHQAWVRRKGFLQAKCDKILTVDIDIRINRNIKKYFSVVNGKIKLVSFAKSSHPPNFRYLIAQLIQTVYQVVKREEYKSFTGLYFFSKKAWLETEDAESIKKIPRGEDTHLDQHLKGKYETFFVNKVKNICFRPKETPKYQYLVGVVKWRTRKDSLWRVVLHSLLYFRPNVLIGYWKAKHAEEELQKKSKIMRHPN
jgi:hypothetical protein